MRSIVFCTLTFEAMHRWQDAPIQHAYLASLHRHQFHVRVEKEVSHDRQIEFIQLKRDVQEFIRSQFSNPSHLEWSCEEWAREILLYCDAVRVEVSEDGENGAVLDR